MSGGGWEILGYDKKRKKRGRFAKKKLDELNTIINEEKDETKFSAVHIKDIGKKGKLKMITKNDISNIDFSFPKEIDREHMKRMERESKIRQIMENNNVIHTSQLYKGRHKKNKSDKNTQSIWDQKRISSGRTYKIRNDKYSKLIGSRMTDDYKYNTNRYTPNNNNPNSTANSMYGNIKNGGYGVTRYSNYAPGYFERRGRGRDRGRGRGRGTSNRGSGSIRGMSSTRGGPSYRGSGNIRSMGSTRGGGTSYRGSSYRGSSYRDFGNQTLNRGRGRGRGGNEFSIRTRGRGSGPDLSGGWSRRMKNTRPITFTVTREGIMKSGNGNNISNNQDIRRDNIIRQHNIMRPQSNIINNNSMRMEQNNNQFNQPINNIQNNNSNTMNMDNNNYTDNENTELKRRPKIDRKRPALRPRNVASNAPPPAQFVSNNRLENKNATNNISLDTEIKNESKDPEDIISPYNRLSPRNLKILRQQKIERQRKKRILDGLNKVNLPKMELLQKYQVPIITDRPDNRKKGPEVVRDLKKYVKSRKKVFGITDPVPMEVQVVPPPIIPRKENNEVDVIKLAQIGGILDKNDPDEFMIETLLEVQRISADGGYYDPKIPRREYPYWSNKSAYYNSYYFENDERYDIDPKTIGIQIRPTKEERKHQGLNIYNSAPLLPLFTELPQHFYNGYPPYMLF